MPLPEEKKYYNNLRKYMTWEKQDSQTSSATDSYVNANGLSVQIIKKANEDLILQIKIEHSVLNIISNKFSKMAEQLTRIHPSIHHEFTRNHRILSVYIYPPCLYNRDNKRSSLAECKEGAIATLALLKINYELNTIFWEELYNKITRLHTPGLIQHHFLKKIQAHYAADGSRRFPCKAAGKHFTEEKPKVDESTALLNCQATHTHSKPSANVQTPAALFKQLITNPNSLSINDRTGLSASLDPYIQLYLKLYPISKTGSSESGLCPCCQKRLAQTPSTHLKQQTAS